MIFYIMSSTGIDVFATTILTHLTYLMYRCYWLKPEISTKNKKQLFRYYTAYVFITLVLLFFLTITYDWRTENGRYTLSPNDHCGFINQFSYSTLYLGEVINVANKFAQVIIFLVYLIYFFKLKADFHEAPNLVQYSRKLFRIAIAMGATIGLSRFISLLPAFDSKFYSVAIISAIILFLIQQIVIMSSFMPIK